MLFKVHMEATGDFEGVETFNYPGGEDTLGIQFKVGETFDISVDEAFTARAWIINCSCFYGFGFVE